jgi:hypothetical protein
LRGLREGAIVDETAACRIHKNCAGGQRRKITASNGPIGGISFSKSCDTIVTLPSLANSLCSASHRWREVKPDKLGTRASRFHERKEPSPTTAQIENAACFNGHKLKQSSFALDAVRNRICAPEIVQGVFRVGPKIDVR